MERMRGEARPRKLFAPSVEMCWTQFKNIGHSSMNLGPSWKTIRPSWCPKLVMGLSESTVNKKF